jgi:hypothetical protein
VLRQGNNNPFEGEMLVYLATEGRILGLDGGDWALLLGGSALLGLVTLFV